MLFRNLFIATLAALAFVGCSDDKDIIEPIPDGIGDVNVVFATTSSEQIQTKAGSLTTDVYENFEPTESVKEYCLKTKVDDPEFVIDHLTVFVFDNNGGLVKTAYFKDQLEETTGMNILEVDKDANSISEFGGIVLKEGTYKFILAGNLTKDQITAASEGNTDFKKYKAATISWTGETGISTEIGNTHLPMIKVLEGIKLIAHKKTATATLNLIGGNSGSASPKDDGDNGSLSVSSAIQLTRLVARVQLKSLKFDWSVKDESGKEVTHTPAASITLKKVYLANASNRSILEGDHVGSSDLVKGFEDTGEMFTGTKDGNLVKAPESSVVIENGKDNTWNNGDNDTAILPLSFYAFGKTISSDATNSNLMLVLECSAAYTGVTAPNKSVYYYVPVSKNEIESIEPNKVYNVNVTLIGQGSDELGDKQEKANVSVGFSVGDWNNGEPIEIDPNPTPVTSK